MNCPWPTFRRFHLFREIFYTPANGDAPLDSLAPLDFCHRSLQCSLCYGQLDYSGIDENPYDSKCGLKRSFEQKPLGETLWLWERKGVEQWEAPPSRRCEQIPDWAPDYGHGSFHHSELCILKICNGSPVWLLSVCWVLLQLAESLLPQLPVLPLRDNPQCDLSKALISNP